MLELAAAEAVLDRLAAAYLEAPVSPETTEAGAALSAVAPTLWQQPTGPGAPMRPMQIEVRAAIAAIEREIAKAADGPAEGVWVTKETLAGAFHHCELDECAGSIAPDGSPAYVCLGHLDHAATLIAALRLTQSGIPATPLDRSIAGPMLGTPSAPAPEGEPR